MPLEIRQWIRGGDEPEGEKIVAENFQRIIDTRKVSRGIGELVYRFGEMSFSREVAHPIFQIDNLPPSMDSLGPFGKVVERVIDSVWDHVVRQVTYILHYKQNVVELKHSVKDLRLEKERIDHQRDAAEKNLHNIEGKVTEWVQQVSEFESTVEEFENDEGHKRARSPNCYVFSYLRNRHRLGRQAKKMAVDVKKLKDESPKFDEVAYRQNVTSNDATLSNAGFVEFGSTKSTMEKVMRHLEDSSVRMIGLYGPGGVGKTTLIKEIARKAKDNKLFDRVARVEITANPNPQKIQEEIAYVLGLRLEGEGQNVRADCLRRRLKREKGNILLILDDLWDKLDLNKLGIPLDDDQDDDLSNNNKDYDKDRKVLKKEKILHDHKGCKLLLISRNRKVLHEEMDVKSIFCLKELDEKDALMLFQKVAKIPNEMSVSKQEIVKKYCAGLPMAIVTVARALRNKSESVWEATLEQLKKQELVGVQTSMDISVKMSYDHLENDEMKSILLVCAQMGHQALIMDLVKYCFGLGILEGVYSIREAREKIDRSIQMLKDSGLVLDGSSNIHFNMHDLVRDAALSIAHKDRNVFTLRNGKLDYWPELERFTSISVCDTDIIDGLPRVISCSQLQFFQINTIDPSLQIPDSFFGEMKNLRVLILTGFHLLNLPSSIEFLLQLRMLCLERCTLPDDLSKVGELKKIRILSFSGSQLKKLPPELRELDKLQLLDISDCSKLEIIPPNIISSLTRLEELYIRKSLIKMLVEVETNKVQDLFLSELKSLHELKVVDLSIPCASDLPNHLFFDKLKDYKIVIGDLEMFSVEDFRMPSKYESFRVLALQLKDNTNIHSLKGIKLLFKTVQILLLGKVDGVQNVVNELNTEGFPDLKHLFITNNNDIKYVTSTELSNCVNVFFPNLESLCLYNLRSLEMICYGPITVASFTKLKTIKVESCYHLKNLFLLYVDKFLTSPEMYEICECKSEMDKFLASLETIEVSECKSLKEILQIPEDYGKIEFLELSTLTLQSLPSFTSFYTKVGAQKTSVQRDKAPPLFGELVVIPNLESLNLSLKKLKSLIISECPNMKKILETEGNSGNKVCIFPKLEEFQLSKMNSLTDMWQTKVSVDSFSSLISVHIVECNKLDKIFPSHMEGWFESLENLKVSDCKSVEVIFEIKDSQEIDPSGGIDTNLQLILLEYLPKLKQLWSKDPEGILNFKTLRTVDVKHCDELRNLFPASVAKDFPKLERMSALFCGKMVGIVASEDASETNKDRLVFPELTCMKLYYLSNIKSFYEGRHPIKCPKLKELTVVGCHKLKIFSTETSKTTNEGHKFVLSAEKVFPKLEYLEIDMEEAQRWLSLNYQMHRLKEFHLSSVESVHLLYQFLYRMPNLENLYLTEDHREVLVPTANSAPQQILGTVIQLKQLFLYWSDVKDLGFERDQVLQRLELLSLQGCQQLCNLAPPAVSLAYLTSLELNYCPGLKNLMASSTAQSMVQLKTMKVIYCGEVEQIVTNEGSEEMKIVFGKLITIELALLNKLASFCSCNNCKFEFPTLEILIIRECPKMKTFTEGSSTTPKLESIFGVEGEEKSKWQWEGDLNATVQKVFNDKLTFITYTQEGLFLRAHNEFIIKEVWLGTHSVQQNSFRRLKSLNAWGWTTLVHVIPSHLLSCFQNLEILTVKSCSSAQVIFNINDENRKASGISRLKKLALYDLPKLEHVWDKDPEGVIDLQMLNYEC
ncbi:unnamed protein product [Sphenostylis stenocarpa]|uniref:AAA+ ATPase domain-containing protein n=1 Tax=Sphenostylis stenocarpa TaxID=92480 RepID=A0AA86SM45_9FABA|nr:unnamed protein product [Sphenostylis stenocarpa]